MINQCTFHLSKTISPNLSHFLLGKGLFVFVTVSDDKFEFLYQQERHVFALDVHEFQVQALVIAENMPKVDVVQLK